METDATTALAGVSPLGSAPLLAAFDEAQAAARVALTAAQAFDHQGLAAVERQDVAAVARWNRRALAVERAFLVPEADGRHLLYASARRSSQRGMLALLSEDLRRADAPAAAAKLRRLARSLAAIDSSVETLPP